MMSTHTPGPWRINPRDRYEILVDEFNAICNLDPDLLGAETPQQLDELAANARLIAAAPDLLAACKAVLLRDDVASDELGDALREAVAKAEGRT